MDKILNTAMAMAINNDAVLQNAKYTYRRLEDVIAAVFHEKRRLFPFNGMYLNNEQSLDIAAEKVVSQLVKGGGRAGIVTHNTTEFPTTIIQVTDEDVPAYLISTKCSRPITDRDSETLAKSNGSSVSVELEENRQMAENMLAETNILGAFGDSETGMTGMLNNPNVTVDDDPFDVYAATDPQVILDWATEKYTTIFENSLMAEMPNVWGVPVKLMTKFRTTYFPNTDQNVYDRLFKTLGPAGGNGNRNLRQIVEFNELKASELELYGVESPGTNKDRMVIYSLNVNNPAAGVAPNYQCFFRKTSPIRTHTAIRGIYEDRFYVQKVGSVINNYPGSAVYVSFPTSA